MFGTTTTGTKKGVFVVVVFVVVVVPNIFFRRLQSPRCSRVKSQSSGVFVVGKSGSFFYPFFFSFFFQKFQTLNTCISFFGGGEIKCQTHVRYRDQFLYPKHSTFTGKDTPLYTHAHTFSTRGGENRTKTLSVSRLFAFSLVSNLSGDAVVLRRRERKRYGFYNSYLLSCYRIRRVSN